MISYTLIAVLHSPDAKVSHFAEDVGVSFWEESMYFLRGGSSPEADTYEHCRGKICRNRLDRLVRRTLQWRTADTERKEPSVENPESSKVVPLKPGVGQNISMHASPIVGDFFLELISIYRSIPKPLQSFSCVSCG